MDGTTTISVVLLIQISGFIITIFTFKNTTKKDIELRAEARGSTNAKLDAMLSDIKVIKTELKENADVFKKYGERIAILESDVESLKLSLKEHKEVKH